MRLMLISQTHESYISGPCYREGEDFCVWLWLKQEEQQRIVIKILDDKFDDMISLDRDRAM